MRVLRLGLAGLGTVGTGVLKLLHENRNEIESRGGCAFQVVAVAARDKGRDRGVDLSGVEWVDSPHELAKRQDIDVVVELMGGEGDPAHALARAALQSGKAFVTANKALLAHHGVELAALAAEKKVPLLFEAAVAGGLPIIKLLREGFAANHIHRLYGILNGTCNFILTKMEDTGRSFEDVLREAQMLGFAEAEPSLDVDGWDTAHKLSLLVALAYNVQPDFKSMTVTGIRAITAYDLQAAEELGYRIKLLGLSERSEDRRILQQVSPCLVPKSSSLAHVRGALNAVYTYGNYVGPGFIEGLGAGSKPTASAVVADLMDIARGTVVAPFGVQLADLPSLTAMPVQEWMGESYLRLEVLDQPGVIADIAAILRDSHISIESLLQKGHDPGQPVAVIITTHSASRRSLDEAVAKIAALKTVAAPPLLMPLLRL